MNIEILHFHPTSLTECKQRSYQKQIYDRIAGWTGYIKVAGAFIISRKSKEGVPLQGLDGDTIISIVTGAEGETKLHFGNYARLSYPRPRCSPRLLADAPLYQKRKRTSWY
jgi:hypothetical protein